MEKILDFLKTLFVPNLMKRYRYMSALISIIIFMASVYLLNFPVAEQIGKIAPEIRETYNYQVLAEIEDSFEAKPENELALQELGALECAVDKGFLVCPKVKKISETENKVVYEVIEKTIEFEKDGITKRVKFVVNLNLVNPKEEEVLDKLEDVPYEENTEYYKVMFISDGLIYQAHQIDINSKNIKHNDKELYTDVRYFTYTGYLPDFNIKLDNQSSRNLGNRVLDALVTSIIKHSQSQAFMYLLLTIFVLPIIFVLILWLFFRRSGKLTTYKEYYNIAAICTIGPILLTFIVSWFWMQAFNYYMYVFAIFYLYSLYKINNTPDDVN